MYLVYIIITVLALFILVVFFIPLRLDIRINKKGKVLNNIRNDKADLKQNTILPSIITIKILKVIPLFKINLDKVENIFRKKNNANRGVKIDKKEEGWLKNRPIEKLLKLIVKDDAGKLKKIKQKIGKYIDKIYIEKLGFSFGFNTEDYVKNAYINASLNSIFCLYINYRRKNVNFKRLYYQIYISEDSYYLDLNSIIKIRLADTMYMIFNVILFIKEELLKNETKVKGKVWNNIQ